jgi:hypothetical protein
MSISDIFSSKKKSKRKKLIKILITITLVLIIVRILLPTIVLRYVNKSLSEMEEYYGHVEDIDIYLYRGAYVIQDIRIVKLQKQSDSKDTIPFFKCRNIDLSIEWKSLLKGSFVSEIIFDEPLVNFVNAKEEDENLADDTADFKTLLKDLIPITINHFEVNNGEVHYIDPNSSPSIDVFMDNIRVVANNLSSVNKDKKLLPANISAVGKIYGGNFDLNMDLDALAQQPTFDLNAELKRLNMVKVNDMLRAYANFDVKKGNYGLYMEFAARKGKFNGYVKPIIKGLDVVQWNKEEGDIGQIAWETLIGTTAEIFQNQSKEQLATKLNIEGEFNDPNLHIWEAVTNVLRNAFWQALKPSLENSINISSINSDKGKKDEGFIEKVFSGEDK